MSNIAIIPPPNTSGGYLELILGPMFSGKTSRLVEIYNHYNENTDENVIVINYIGDKRYHATMLSTHDEVFIPCEFTSSLKEWLDTSNIKNTDVILINEGQFFEDLYVSVHIMVEELHKKVYVCGLDGDYRREKIGHILDLIPICDNIVKLTSRCSLCHGVAIFSHRKTEQVEQYVIGSIDTYMPLCRRCYLVKTKKQYVEDASKTIN